MSQTSYRGRPPDPAPHNGRRRKATLFCSTCGHESPAGEEGDWLVSAQREAGERALAYVCPECDATLTVQPVY